MNRQDLPADSEAQACADAWQQAAAASSVVLEAHAIRYVDAAGTEWVDSGIDLRRGQSATLLASGQVWMSREADLHVGPKVALWFRIGDGPVQRALGAGTTFAAERDGRLWLVTRIPGDWIDVQGRFAPDFVRPGASGGVLVAALAWTGTAAAGLQAFAAADTSGAASAELQRLSAPVVPPSGWQPLWRIGQSSVFRRDDEAAGGPVGRPRIHCRCSHDAAILTHAVDVPLDASLRLAWSWCVEQLPSQLAEDTLPTHDYLSIAAEFDNGQDLTYMWSRSLPVDTSFRCPLPWWDEHETHIVARSGTEELGRWLAEEKPLLADYQRAVGGTAPARVIAIWLIAVSAFKRGTGVCAYRDIRLQSDAGTTEVPAGS